MIGAAGLVAVAMFGGCSTDDESATQAVDESALRPVGEDTVDEQMIERHEAAKSQVEAAGSFAVTIRDGVPTVLTLDCDRVLAELWLQTTGFAPEEPGPDGTDADRPRERLEDPRIDLPLESSTMDDSVRMFALTDDQWTSVQAGLAPRPGVESPLLLVGYAFDSDITGSRSTGGDWPTFPLVQNLAAEDELDPLSEQTFAEFRDSCDR
jgi:hypothetical protein